MPAAAALALETRTDAVVAVVEVLADEKPLHADEADAPEDAEGFDDVDDVPQLPPLSVRARLGSRPCARALLTSSSCSWRASSSSLRRISS